MNFGEQFSSFAVIIYAKYEQLGSNILFYVVFSASIFIFSGLYGCPEKRDFFSLALL